MPQALGEQAIVTIDSITQGHKALEFCKDSKIADGSSREAKNAMGSRNPIGTVRKPGAQTITLSIYAQQGDPEVDWFYLRDTDEMFGIFREVVGGTEAHYPEVQVSKIDEDDDEDGNHMLNVELIALGREKMS